ncbi:hypothetical protein G7084_05460 [Weissella coleopterorum]|uniref:Uncharacterized protein n=1 Tax=Weissella coleopterorum TaxID=2714949 RepID=A0A6G8B0H0_9LACO|nr:hypothetical protein G7084_05460 [Weissella coleopterorum]
MLWIGVTLIIVGVFVYHQYNSSRELIKSHQKRLISEQLYDSQLIHLDKNKMVLKDGTAYITMYVAKNTNLKIHHEDGLLEDSYYKSQPSIKRVKLAFILPGVYEATATRDGQKVTKKIEIKNIESSASIASSSSKIISSVVPSIQEAPVSSNTNSLTTDTTNSIVESPIDNNVNDVNGDNTNNSVVNNDDDNVNESEDATEEGPSSEN